MSKLKLLFFLRKMDLVFCFAIIAGILLIYNIPFGLLFKEFTHKSVSKNLHTVTVPVISILFCCLVAKRVGIKISRENNTGNYWMLIIPLLFPSILSYAKFSVACYESITAGLLVASAYLMSAMAEEVAFRGLVQGYLTSKYPQKSNHQICFITAIFFAIIHFNNIQYVVLGSVINQVIYAFFMGLLFSALMIRIGNVWLLGIAHGFLNIISTACSVTDSNQSGSVINGSLVDHLVQIAGMVLVFSPTLLIYWFLLKGAKPRNFTTQVVNGTSSSL